MSEIADFREVGAGFHYVIEWFKRLHRYTGLSL